MESDLQRLFDGARAGHRPFAEPWQAQAFSMTLTLHAAGHFTWQEWADALSRELVANDAQSDDVDEIYYSAWLRTLEQMCASKALIGMDELIQRKQDWDRAARATEHGKPIELSRVESAPGKDIPTDSQ